MIPLKTLTGKLEWSVININKINVEIKEIEEQEKLPTWWEDRWQQLQGYFID